MAENDVMGKLLASQSKKLVNVSRGQQVEGTVISLTDKELILDIGAKSEGVLPASRGEPKRELETQDIKVGDKLTAFVNQTENDSGQVVLSMQRRTSDRRFEGGPARGGAHPRGGKGRRFIDWNKLFQAQNQNIQLKATVSEINKGGLIVEAEGIRGFLPNSQVGFELLSRVGGGMDALIGQTLNLTVIEVDPDNNKLIFSQRGQVSDDVRNELKKFDIGSKVKGKIVAILPFGLVVDINGVEGLVFISDVAWEKVEDLSKMFKVGQELEVLVTGIDEELGRLNLSIKQLSEDPFTKITQKYAPDEAVKGEIISVTEEGVVVNLDPSDELGTSGIEGLLPQSRMQVGTSYEVGKEMSFLVDSVDSKRRRINLAPFVTSTEGLIYK